MRFRKLVVQNIIWRGAYLFSQLLLNVLISRFFKANGSGAIYYTINNLSFLLLIISLSLESGATYYVAKQEINNHKIAILLLSWSLIGTGISMAFFKWAIDGSGNIFTGKPEYVIGCSCYVLGILLTTYFSSLFFAKHNFFVSNFILCFVNALLILLLALPGKISYIHDHFVIIYFCSFLLQGVTCAAVFFFQDIPVPGIGFLSGAELSKLLRYSLFALVSNIVFFLVYRVDYWFVKRFCSESELGNYIQVSKLVQLFLMLPITIASIVFPYTAGKKNKESIKNVKALCRLLVCLFSALTFILACVGYWLFPFVFGDSFFKMFAPYCMFIPGIISLAILAVLAAYFAGSGKVKINLTTSFIGLIIIIAGDFLFIPRGGIVAAAAVSSAGYLVCTIYSLYVFLVQENIKLAEMLIIKKNDFNWLTDFIFPRNR